MKKLPTHEQAEKAVLNGTATPLEFFIAHYEIAGPDDSLWRHRLREVIKQAYKRGWDDREGDLLAGVERVVGKT